MKPRASAAALCLLVAAVGAGGAKAQVRDWPSERPPRPLAAREVKFPPYAMRTLGNGLQVIAVSHHEQPAVSLRLLIRAGGALDPAEKPGVAALAAAVLDQGTSSRTAEQIATTIDSIGGVMGSSSGTDLSFVQAIVMKDSLNLALDLVSDVARNPAFAPEEIERQRQQMLSGLKVSYDDAEYLAGVVFDRLVYGFHPYGRPDAGTPESIAAITRQDLQAFHKRWFGPNNSVLAIVGDVSAEEAFAGAERAFGKWGKSEANAERPSELPPPARRLVVIDRPGAVQTEIRVGHTGLPRKHPDYLALDLAVKILGGEGGNRLYRVLRSERGLTYGASADTNALKDGGDIVAETDTRSETTGEALRLIVDEMWRLQRQRVSQRELADAQAYLTGSFPLTIETPSAIALQVLNAVFYGLDLNELQTFRERVNAITVDDIQRVAKAYLHPDRLSIVLVGDADAFARQLAGVGFEQYERIPVGDLDLTSANLRRPAAAPPPGVQPAAYSRALPRSRVRAVAQRGGATSAEARQLIDRAVTAKGTLPKLRAVRTVRATATVTVIDPQAGRVAIPTTTSIRYPGGFRVDARLPAGLVVQAFNAGQYWVQDERGPREAPPQLAMEIRSHVQRDIIPLLIGLADGRIAAVRAADEVDGTRSLPVLLVEGGGMRKVSLVLDPDSLLIVRQRYDMENATMEERFSEYRTVDGVRVPFRAEVLRNGVPLVERSVDTIEFNVPLAASLFTKPS
ncbi:MAG TPA: insulinase family protein [Vicinamibacterales bacterium]|nr:insulinase family protein [Vicinamibacterales bacterium]